MRNTRLWVSSIIFILTVVILLPVDVSAQLLLNEVEFDAPNPANESCSYAEVRGTAGSVVPAGVAFVSIDGDSASFGNVNFVANLGGVTVGSNGTITVINDLELCPNRVFPAGSTQVLVTSFTGLGLGAESYLLISSPTPVVEGDDIDANEDRLIDPVRNITVIDGIGFTVNAQFQAVYAPNLYDAFVETGGSSIELPDAATRFPNNLVPLNRFSWYFGELDGAPDAATAYSGVPQSANFPVGGQLTPGTSNVGTQPRDSVVDINGDGRTDFVVVRSTGGAGTQSTWLSSLSGGNPTSQREWGINGDLLVPGDYDGDGKDDVAVFRASNGTFYVIESATLTIRVDQFGQAGDNPRVVGDYNGDGRDDLSLYRAGTQSTWFYKTSSSSLLTAVDWGQTGDSPAPGDYDGDGKADFVVQRPDGANGRFWIRTATGAISSEQFGLANDDVVPGDYDGDGRTDLCTVRTTGGFYVWDFEPSGTAGSTVVSDTWGVPGDLTVQGDYDGDGKTDYAIWRPGTPGTFYMMTVGTRFITTKDWGQTGDLPAARYNTF